MQLYCTAQRQEQQLDFKQIFRAVNCNLQLHLDSDGLWSPAIDSSFLRLCLKKRTKSSWKCRSQTRQVNTFIACNKITVLVCIANFPPYKNCTGGQFFKITYPFGFCWDLNLGPTHLHRPVDQLATLVVSRLHRGLVTLWTFLLHNLDLCRTQFKPEWARSVATVR